MTAPSLLRALSLFVAAALGVAPSFAQETLRHSDGAILGGSITYHLDGEAGRLFVLLPSATTGPTFLPGGHVLDIGLDLLGNEAVGFLDGSTGTASITIPLPGDAVLQGLALYAQYVTIGPPTPPIEAVSNRAGAALALPGTTVNTIGTCATARQGHTATRLANGTVLVAGGDEPDSLGNLTALSSLELYDPATQEFTLLPATMSHARSTHTATLLADGRVLLLGGYDTSGTVRNTGDLFDPVAGTITAIAPMTVARTQHTATLQPNGKVFVAGGSKMFDLNDLVSSLAQAVKSSAIFDPVANTWTAGPDIPLGEDGLIGHSATLLGNGQILVTGGVIVDVIIGLPIPAFTNRAWRMDTGTGTWVGTASMGTTRTYHGQVSLSDGTALVVGGANGDFVLQNFFTIASTERYDPVGNQWLSAPTLNDPRAYPNVVHTGNEIVVVGGLGDIDPFNGSGTPEQTIEYAPLSLTAWTASGETLLPRQVARAVVTDGGERVLVIGTGDNGVAAVDRTAETYATE